METIGVKWKIFEVRGKVISQDQIPITDIWIEVFDEDPMFELNDLLGTTLTDTKGFFEVKFDQSKFDDFFEASTGTPNIYIILRNDQKNDLLKTGSIRTKKEIQYQIRIEHSSPNATALDHYSGNARRLLSKLNDVGELIGIEQRINVEILKNTDPIEENKVMLKDYVHSFEDRRTNMDHFIIVINSLVDSLGEGIRTEGIDYDGPQVPRFPRREHYNQVIIWPKQEKFKWA